MIFSCIEMDSVTMIHIRFMGTGYTIALILKE